MGDGLVLEKIHPGVWKRIETPERIPTLHDLVVRIEKERGQQQNPSVEYESLIEAKYAEAGGITTFGQPLYAQANPISKGFFREYQQGGNIYYSEDTGAHVVRGDVLQYYSTGQLGINELGFPLADQEQLAPTPPRDVCRFEKGAIYWSQATGTHGLDREIFAHYLRLGAEGSFLGIPISDQTKITKLVPSPFDDPFEGEPHNIGDGPNLHVQKMISVAVGEKCDFERGTIYWLYDAGAFEVHGGIRDRYRDLRETEGILGFPMSDETIIFCDDGKPSDGRLSHFKSGTIYWSPRTGAFEVYGPILEYYNQKGGPLASGLGYPISTVCSLDDTNDETLKYTDFENGVVLWDPQKATGSSDRIQDIRAVRVHIDQVTSANIHDGIGGLREDKTAELITYTTLKVDGNPRLDRMRSPKDGHEGTVCQIDIDEKISPIHHDTTIYLTIEAWDWDKLSDNDFLGTVSRVYDIDTLWGKEGGGAYTLTSDIKGDSAPSKETIQYVYSIKPAVDIDPNKGFREQYWWRFDNFSTKQLSREQFAQTFTDVEMTTNWYDDAWNPVDTAYYHTMYKGLASKGNCFGMCVEALYSEANASVFTEPLYQWNQGNRLGDKVRVEEQDLIPVIPKMVNLKHGYQVGDKVISHIINLFSQAALFSPHQVYLRVRNWLAQGDRPILALFDALQGSGHAVLAYKCEDGSGDAPDRILVADPNMPWRSMPGDPTYIEIRKNNSFCFTGGTTPYESSPFDPLGLSIPSTLMLDVPWHWLASAPKTPFWALDNIFVELLGGFILLAGEAETAQITDIDASKYFYQIEDGNKKVKREGLLGMARIPLLDFDGKIPEFYAQIYRFPRNFQMEIQGSRVGSFSQFLRTQRNAVSVTGPSTNNSRDVLRFAEIHSAQPNLRIQTNEPPKVIHVDYAGLQDSHKKRACCYGVNLQVAQGDESYLGTVGWGENLIVKPAGPVGPFDVTFESRVGSQVRRSIMKYTPAGVGEVVRVYPQDWTSPLDTIVVERMNALKGEVVSRQLMPATVMPLQ